MRSQSEDFLEKYQALGQIKNATKRAWAEGDLFEEINEAQKKHQPIEKDRNLLREFLDETGIPYPSYYNRRWVAGIYSSEERNQFTVPWAQFRMVACLPNRLELLSQSQAYQWTTRQLKFATKGVLPGEAVRVCNYCGKEIKPNAITVEGVPGEGLLRFCNPGCLVPYFEAM